VISILGALVYMNSYVIFQPIIFDGDEFKSIKVDNVFYKKLEEVLKEEDVSYRIKDGRIYIKRLDSYDDEKKYNYTEKALDSNKRGKVTILKNATN
jgi:competence protein ComGF